MALVVALDRVKGDLTESQQGNFKSTNIIFDKLMDVHI